MLHTLPPATTEAAVLCPASRPTRPHPRHTQRPAARNPPHPARQLPHCFFHRCCSALSLQASFFSQSNSLPLNPHWRTRRSVSDPLHEATTLIPGPAFSNQAETPSWITEVPQGHDSSHPAPQSVWSACCFLLPLIPVCFILHYIIVSSDTILKSKPTVYVSWTNFRKYRKIRKGSLLVFASQVFFLWTYSRHSNIQKGCMINTDF